MKKLIYGSLFLATVGITIIGCQKEVIPSPTNTAINTSNPQKGKGQSNTEKEEVIGHRTFRDLGHYPGIEGVDYGCFSTSGNCLETVTVSPSQISNVQSFGNDIKNGNATADSATFANHKTFLLTFMRTSDFNNVINGVYTVDVRGTTTTSTSMYILIEDTSAVIAAYPIHG